MFKFLDLDPEAFGIDICDNSMKIARLKRSGKHLRLSSWGESEIEKGIIEEGEIKDEERLAKAIKTGIEKINGEKLDTQYVIASLPENKAFLRVIKMPRMNPDELKIAIPFEAENYIPLPVSKCYIDFQILKKDSDGQIEILIAAVPKHISDSYAISLRKAELTPLALEIESQSVSRSLIKGGHSKAPVLIIDLGKNTTGFTVFHNHSLAFTLSVPISSELLTESISESLKVSFEEAEKIKLDWGISSSSKKVAEDAAKAIMPAVKDLAKEIKKCIEYYNSHKKDDGQISKILICGGGGNLRGLPEMLSAILKIKTELGNPWVNVFPDLMTEIPGLNFKESLGHSTAIGLALRGIKKYD